MTKTLFLVSLFSVALIGNASAAPVHWKDYDDHYDKHNSHDWYDDGKDRHDDHDDKGFKKNLKLDWDDDRYHDKDDKHRKHDRDDKWDWIFDHDKHRHYGHDWDCAPPCPPPCTPTPLPGSALLFGSTLLGMAAFVSRRRLAKA